MRPTNLSLFPAGCRADARRTAAHPIRHRTRILLLLCSGLAAAPPAFGAEEGFRDLFDGRTLAGWKAADRSYWSVEAGAITGRITPEHPCRTNQYLIWQGGELADFELKLRHRVSGSQGLNCGFQFRSRELPDHDVAGYQVDNNLDTDWLVRLYDEHGRHTLAWRGQRAVFDEAGRATHTDIAEAKGPAWFRLEDWHEYHLICAGPRLTLKVDGRLAAEVVDHDPQQRDVAGILALQLHSGPPTVAQFKDIRLKPLTPAERAADRPDLLIADFEGADYGEWKATGEAFGPGPARGTLPNQMKVDGFLGQGLVNSFFKGDGATGALTSPSFTIERRFLRFLVGGGKHPGKTCMNLVLDGQTVRTATGPNDKPGGSERLDWEQWDVGEFAGRRATLQIVDLATGGWGHINVDHILQTDRPLPATITNASRELVAQKRYLNLPVKNGAPKRRVSLLVDDRLAREFEIELADAEPDWWAFLDLAPFHGQRAVLRVDRLREDSGALRNVEQADDIRGAADLYREPLRPQFHFTSRRGWNNDPNGLVFHEGEYHLFYQHNPYGWSWGNMHWGHAVSRDLVHWEELGGALYPDELGTMWSGSAVVDRANTAGFARGGEPAIVCFYTAAGGTGPQSQGKPFTQCLAYSTDRGRTWTKYDKNPVLPHVIGENRDPKVIWYEPERKWVMALYLDKSDFALFASRDLKQWQRLSDVTIPGTSECPEFFEIPVDGDRRKTRWIFYGGNGRYLIGRFDGRTFTPESGPHALHFGNCFYASQTFHDIPAADGRRILIAWGQVNLPGMPFNQMMTFPVELTLRGTDDGLRLFVNPAREIASLRARTHTLPAQPLRPGDNPLAGVAGELFDVTVEFAPGDATEVSMNVRGVPVVWSAPKQELSCLNKKAALKPVAGHVRLRLLVDRASIEIFGNDGRLYLPMGAILKADHRALEIAAKGGTAQLRSAAVHELQSAWTPASAGTR
jgi:fructan beta-fructosidase